MTWESPPRVTVLSTIYSDARFVREAVESVLSQSYRDFEYVIVNDASIDESRSIVSSIRDSRIRIIDNEVNLGLTRSLNRGLEAARGEYVVRLDANDICLPGRIEKQVAFLDSNRHVAVVGGQARVIDRKGRRLKRAEFRRPVTPVAVDWYCMLGNPIVHSTATFRLEVVREEFGGYDEEFRVAQDTALWLRVSRRYSITNLDVPVIKFRVDPHSISGNPAREERAGHRERWLRIIEASFRRFLGMEVVPEEWVRLWVDFNGSSRPLSKEDVIRVGQLIQDVFDRFSGIYPGAVGDPDIAQSRFLALRRAAEMTAATSRLTSMALLRSAAAIDGSGALSAVPRLAAVWIAGGLALRLRRLKARDVPGER